MLDRPPQKKEKLFSSRSFPIIKKSVFLCCFLLIWTAFTQDVETKDKDQALINQFIQSKGAGIISFDAKNIKQFWTDNSVISRKDYFEVFLNNQKSIPFKIQLANVSGVQDCRIELISDTSDVSFTVSNMNSKIMSVSKKEDDFMTYSVFSSIFHLSDTIKENSSKDDFCFQLSFSSQSLTQIRIRAIVLSFYDADNVFASSGTIKLSADDMTLASGKIEKGETDGSFLVTGKRSSIITKKSFPVSDHDISVSVKIKNTGNSVTKINTGYKVLSEDYIPMSGASYPYKNNNMILNVVSSEKNSNIIVVDSYTETWAKNNYIALNAKEDMSDVPSTHLLESRISEIVKNDDGTANILLEKPLTTPLKRGEKIRVHRGAGPSIYSNIVDLQPGEEKVFTHTIKKDNNVLTYSSKAFSRGVFYSKLIILSYSLDSKEENTIQISDYSVSY